MKLILIGFGTVGQGLAQILHEKADDLKTRYGFTPQILGVATNSKGILYHPDGLSIEALLDARKQGHLDNYPDSDGLIRDWDVTTLIEKSGADVMVESTWTNLETAEPALTYCQQAIDAGQHIVMANKGPVALAYDELMVKASEKEVTIRYEGSVMAGTPTLNTAIESLAGCTITEVQGILNGTTNYILTQMADGIAYSDALKTAQDLGYAEADPTADVDGWDAASKVLILARAIFGASFTLEDLDVTGISQLTLDDIHDAQANDERYKLIAKLTNEGGSVSATRLSISHPLASVMGATNAITFTTDLMGDVTIIGAGAGERETGYALLTDLLAIHRKS